MTDKTKPQRRGLADLLKDVCLPTSQQKVDNLLEQYQAKFPMPEETNFVPRPYNGVPHHVALTDQHLIDAMKHLQISEVERQARIAAALGAKYAGREKTLSDFSSADLVMEMLARGFAVMKLPEDGGPPEVLK